MSGTAAKTKKAYLRDIADDFETRVGREYELDDLVHWAIKSKRWEPPRRNVFKMAREEFRTALRSAKDDKYVRTYFDAQLPLMIDGEPVVKRVYASRKHASYALRQAFLSEQFQRARGMLTVVDKLRATLDDERKPGEPAFQLVLPLGSDGEEYAPVE